MSICLIDDRGETWPGACRRLREAFDSPYSGGEFAHYAIANLGFAAISERERSLRVRLRPAIVGEATWDALRQRLLDPRLDRVAVAWLDEDWRDEILRTQAPAIRRIEALMADVEKVIK